MRRAEDRTSERLRGWREGRLGREEKAGWTAQLQRRLRGKTQINDRRLPSAGMQVRRCPATRLQTERCGSLRIRRYGVWCRTQPPHALHTLCIGASHVVVNLSICQAVNPSPCQSDSRLQTGQVWNKQSAVCWLRGCTAVHLRPVHLSSHRDYCRSVGACQNTLRLSQFNLAYRTMDSFSSPCIQDTARRRFTILHPLSTSATIRAACESAVSDLNITISQYPAMIERSRYPESHIGRSASCEGFVVR